MQMVFTPSARDDLGTLRRWARDSGTLPDDGLRQVRRTLTARVTTRLGAGPLPGLREVPIPSTPFRLICRYQDDRVEVLAVTSNPE